MSLQLSVTFRFDASIVFDSFAPMTKADGLRLGLGDAKYNVTVYVCDPCFVLTPMRNKFIDSYQDVVQPAAVPSTCRLALYQWPIDGWLD